VQTPLTGGRRQVDSPVCSPDDAYLRKADSKKNAGPTCAANEDAFRSTIGQPEGPVMVMRSPWRWRLRHAGRSSTTKQEIGRLSGRLWQTVGYIAQPTSACRLRFDLLWTAAWHHATLTCAPCAEKAAGGVNGAGWLTRGPQGRLTCQLLPRRHPKTPGFWRDDAPTFSGQRVAVPIPVANTDPKPDINSQREELIMLSRTVDHLSDVLLHRAGRKPLVC
jgi:hypothetical protein